MTPRRPIFCKNAPFVECEDCTIRNCSVKNKLLVKPDTVCVNEKSCGKPCPSDPQTCPDFEELMQP